MDAVVIACCTDGMIHKISRYMQGRELAYSRNFKFPDEETGEILAVSFRGRKLYIPPFGICGLGEDETAAARVLAGMKKYVDGGEEVYPLRYALEDAYTANLMTTAAGNSWQPQKSQNRPWK